MGIGYGGASSLVTPREDIGLGFDPLDLDALRAGYVGLQIAPVAEANVAFGQYRTMDLNQMLQPRVTSRNSDGGFKRIDADFKVANYKTEDHGLEMRVDNRDSAIYSELIDSDMVAGMLTRHGIIEAHEQRVIAKINAMSKTTVTNEFDDDAANITNDFRAYKEAFRMQCGFYPNAMVLDQSMVDALMENSSVLDKFVGSSGRTAKDINLVGLAAALGIDEVIPSNSIKNTVASPKTASLATTWTKDYCLLFRKSSLPPVVAPQFMRTIHWSGNGSRVGASFEEYEDPKTDGRIIRARMETAEEIIYTQCGLLLDGIVTD
jgi:hypothetical protein